MKKKLLLSSIGVLMVAPLSVGAALIAKSKAPYRGYTGETTKNQNHLLNISNEQKEHINLLLNTYKDNTVHAATFADDQITFSPSETISLEELQSYFIYKNNLSYNDIYKFFNSTHKLSEIANNWKNGEADFKNILYGIYAKRKVDSSFVYFNDQYTNLKDSIENGHADLSIYYTSPGTFPWATFVKHAVLTDNDAYMFKISNWPGLSHQSDFNSRAFIEFKHSRGFEGRVYDTPKFDMRATQNKILEVLEENKDKKINLFLNGEHIGEDFYDAEPNPQWLADKILSKYPNVRINLIEDGVASTIYRLSNNDVKWDKQYAPYLTQSSHRVDFYTLADTQTKFPNIKTLDPSDSELSDMLFNKRHAEDGAYFSNWTKILGINWEKMRSQIQQVNANGKKSLLILGSYDIEGEVNWTQFIYNKYHNEYNIFYKGHPGHNIESADVTKLNNNSNPDFITQNIHMLPNNLPSEELTNNHVSEGLKFDKFAMSDWSGAIDKIPANGYNTKHDLLEVIIGLKNSVSYSKGTPEFDNFINSNVTAKEWWGKYAR